MSEQKTEAINGKREEWIAAVNGGDLEGYLKLLAEDVRWFPPAGEVIAGREEFRQWVGPFLARFDYEFALSEIRVRIYAGWAVERGVFTSFLTPKTGGEQMRHTGRYMVFWSRRKDGRWEIERYVDDPAG